MFKEIYEKIINDKKIIDRYENIRKFEDKTGGWAYHDLNHIKRVEKIIDNVLNKLEFDEEFIKGMSSGVEICGQVTKSCKVFRMDNNTFKIILTQGLNKQIRRMSKVFGYNVVKLERVRIMNITLDGIEYGKYRFISKNEVEEMLRLTEKNNL